MLVAVAVCPHPPVLVPQVAAGAARELDGLRAACDQATAALVATEPTTIAVIGRAPAAGAVDGRGGSLHGYGVPLDVGEPPRSLPLALTVGCWLLDRATWRGPRAYIGVTDGGTGGVTDGTTPAVPAEERLALLVMADGSARRSEKAPGYLDPRAAAFDAALAAALGSGPDELARLDAALGAEVLAAGVPALHALAALTAGRQWTCDVHYDDAPYGVGYVVASWLPA